MGYSQLVQALPQHRMHMMQQDAGPSLPQLQQLRHLVAYSQRALIRQYAAVEVQQLASRGD